VATPFHAVTSRWFGERVGVPTDVQQRAWPAIAAGGHVLVTAPTGTGKTLAAFLGALDTLLAGAWPGEGLRVLYVSPLKALNTDIERNLLGPLAELTERFEAAGLQPPKVEVMVRSGDSTESDRRRLRRHPPAILITTPESLNILLTQGGAAALFQGLRLVLLDEIHAVAGSKRGTSLWLALERLADLAGEYQRVGLSATVNPPDLVARVLGGFGTDGMPRPVTLVASPTAKAYEIQVVLPATRVEDDETGKVFWGSLALELRQRVRETSSTLIFANSRRACEKLVRLMNESQDELVAYSHHGSLSKEIRHDVESRLKSGDLRAVVATNSLELGIDIGDLDEVVLAQTPRTAASAIQKVGRAGHRTGQVSRARLYPSHGLDLVEAAVIARCIRDQSVEPVAVPEGALDVLAQTLLSALCARPATGDQLYALVTRAWPFRALARQGFDLVLDLLAGRYAGSRLAELKPRIEQDPATGAWSAKSAVPFLLYSSGGTIPDRGYFTLRDLATGTALGELDEEFVWERTVGERFALGAQVWKIAAITDEAVKVEPVDAAPHIIPFWKAEDQDRAWFLAEKVGTFLHDADRAHEQGGPALELWNRQLMEGGFSPEAADSLNSTLTRERDALGCLPHRWRLVIEEVVPDKKSDEAAQYVIHTFWGGRVNRPWAYALAQAWEDKYGYALETYPGDDQILVLVPPDADLMSALDLVDAANLEELLRRRLQATGYFGARFREGAGRALLLPKGRVGGRTPLWQTRLKAKRLFEAVAGLPDFPIVLEAWRQCLHDEFELEELKTRLEERASGRIETVGCRTSKPSPFTEGLLWRQVNVHLYEGDEPSARSPSRLDSSLWDQLVAGERPRLPLAAVADWEARWGRTAEGYAPETPADLADLLEVRVALSEPEWRALVAAAARDSGRPAAEWEALPVVHRSGRVGVAAVAGLWDDPEPLWLRWLEGRGPVALERFAVFWERPTSQVEVWAANHAQSGVVVVGRLTEGAVGDEVCLTRTWDQLVRRLRLERRSVVPVRPAAGLPWFVAHWQGVTDPRSDALQRRVGQLVGLPLPAGLWEAAILPSRLEPYRATEFDRLFVEDGLRWFGAGPEAVTLGFAEDKASFVPTPSPADTAELDRVFGGSAEAGFEALADRSRLSTAALTEALWSLAWRGMASATTFGPLRRGLRSGFRYDTGAEPGRVPARGFQRWSSARSSSGTWRRWDGPANTAAPALDALEDAKRRARLVLDRYGIVFRTLLAHEAGAFQWKALFPALRLMELSGEIQGGLFWEGIPGLQFATPEALRSLELAAPGTLWVQHAQDPSSLCGLGLEAFAHLPRRTAGTWLWWKGSILAATLTAGAKKLSMRPELQAADVAAFIRRTAVLLLSEGKTHWTLETLDGEAAPDQGRAPEFLAAGFHRHGDKLVYWKAP
jgi:ATP-dependent Lhr-like helicase